MDRPNSLFPVVGIGASAGGLEPLEELFANVSVESEMAYIVVQHSDPHHQSLLPEILGRRTSLPVVQAQDGATIEAKHIYTCPSDALLSVSNGKLTLTPRTKTAEPVLAIDGFFASLAVEFQNRAVGVVLSGSGSDGSMGLRDIKDKGGITFAQDQESSKFDSMPQSAVATGSVDFVLPAKSIGLQLGQVAGEEYLRCDAAKTSIEEAPDSSSLKILLSLIHKSSGVDFSQYKHGTVSRRIARRMALHKIRGLAEFAQFLKKNPEALRAVGQDILIQVTKFFREPEIFEILKQRVFPGFVKNRAAGEPIRVWIPGCSSGEEVYSILISLVEFLEAGNHRFPLQFFGTDLSDEAINKARAATYFENISVDVSPERLKRFFVRTGNSYELNKSYRDMCIFAKHNVVTDPPFGKLDLVSCRNLLIYLEVALQNRALSIFHFALKPQGVLVLGNAETASGVSDIYEVLDAKHRFYEKKQLSNRLYFDFVGARHTAERLSAPLASLPLPEGTSRGVQMQRDADRFLIGEWVPPSVLVSEKLEVVQFRGKTVPYFEHSAGFASLDLYGMLKEGLITDVRKSLEFARAENRTVRKEGIRFRSNGDSKRVAIEVFPRTLPSTGERYFILLFEAMDAPAFDRSKLHRDIQKADRLTEGEIEELSSLRAELGSTKAYLQSVNEEKEATNEELKAANEEIMSSNEELQSTNEELHSAKEELQSTNEELLTVNDELKLRNSDLSGLNDDLSNLFHSLNSAMVLLTKDLRVRRFTPVAEVLLRLLPADVGRSIFDIRPHVEVQDLQKLLLEVVATGQSKELEVEDLGGKWYTVQIKPYRTRDGGIDGAVLLFTDVTRLKTSLIYAEAIEGMVAHPLLVLTGDLKVKRANQKFYDVFQTTTEATENHFIYKLGAGQWDVPELRKLLEEVLPKSSEFSNFEISSTFAGLGKKTMRLSGRRLFYNDKATETILLAVIPV